MQVIKTKGSIIMNIEFYKSTYAIYFLPTVVYTDYKWKREIKISFLVWHLFIEWIR